MKELILWGFTEKFNFQARVHKNQYIGWNCLKYGGGETVGGGGGVGVGVLRRGVDTPMLTMEFIFVCR